MKKSINDLKDEEIIEGLLRIGPHARIAAHIPGRIRLKISMEGARILNNGTNYEGLHIPGILSFRVNTFAGSIIIEYDPDRIPHDLWERLGRLRENPERARDLATELRTVLTK